MPKPKLLEGFRALDLTNSLGLMCGKILAAIGVEVIKVERPGGDDARSHPPFASGTPDPECSLLWWAYNTDKKSITLDLENPAGQDLLHRLVARADFVIESFTPGYLASLGLDYAALSQINPRIIVTSITPFGQDGPYSRFKASELIVSAMSGVMAGNGDPDRPPLREGPDAITYLANAAAAAGTLVAHYHRELTGEGQQVDVSMQHASAVRGELDLFTWEFDRKLLKRNGPYRGVSRPVRWVYPCKDGHAYWSMMAGAVGAPANRALSQWMDEKGIPNPLHRIEDWEHMQLSSVPPDEFSAMQEAIAAFFMTLSKDEIEQDGRRRGINASVVKTTPEILENPQLQARDYWVALEGLQYPGYYFLSDETDNRVGQRAPHVGEHNALIYEHELGLSPAEMQELRQNHVV